jgi:hypothetical protein
MDPNAWRKALFGRIVRKHGSWLKHAADRDMTPGQQVKHGKKATDTLLVNSPPIAPQPGDRPLPSDVGRT